MNNNRNMKEVSIVPARHDGYAVMGFDGPKEYGLRQDILFAGSLAECVVFITSYYTKVPDV